MHRITKFKLEDCYISYVDPRIVAIMREKIDNYNKLAADQSINRDDLKELYLEILYSNPSGFKLTARMTTDYRQLKTIYQQRKDHRLPEWRLFTDWIATLPEAELITYDSNFANRKAKEILVDLANQGHPERRYTMLDKLDTLTQAILTGTYQDTKKG